MGHRDEGLQLSRLIIRLQHVRELLKKRRQRCVMEFVRQSPNGDGVASKRLYIDAQLLEFITQLQNRLRIIESQLTVRQVEEEARNKSLLGRFNAPARLSSARQKAIAEYFSNIFGTKVKVKQGDTGKGRIEISFKSDEDLERIKRLLESR